MDETNKFQVGDVVQLKSGGLPMVIQAVIPDCVDFSCSVAWLTTAGEFQRQNLISKSLLKVEDQAENKEVQKFNRLRMQVQIAQLEMQLEQMRAQKMNIQKGTPQRRFPNINNKA